MTLNNELLSHQKEAVEKLRKLRVGALFMEQGTGKTITTIELARIRYEAGRIDSVIWLCPCSAKLNIKMEILKQAPRELSRIFIICGIETLSSSVKANSFLLNHVKTHKVFLVVDESLLVKNPKAYRTENIIRISNECPYRIILNGTPISRNEADLFAQFYILDWRILGYRTYWSFAANHLEYDEHGKVSRVLNVNMLAKKISPYSFQIRKSECMELPRKKYSIEYFNITTKQYDSYVYAATILLDQVDEYQPTTIYRLFACLQAIISGKKITFDEYGTHFETSEFFSDPLQNPRIQALMRVLPVKEKAIIFCRYESEISQLCSILPNAVRFDGSVSLKNRNKNLDLFRGEKQFLIANKNCAGYSLNLQFCHNIIYMSNDWELGKRLQSEDRVHRLGQEHEVNVIDLCADGTIDEKMLECLYRKEGLLNRIIAELDNSANYKDILKRIIYGSRYNHDIFDCSDLEDADENI